MLKYIRPILGKVLLFVDRMTSPTPVSRSLDVQEKIDLETQKLALYQFEGCPFCIKVRRAIKRMNLNIELRDAQTVPQFKKELITGGGEYQTPCLRIAKDDGSFQWMYESDDIIQHLKKSFS